MCKCNSASEIQNICSSAVSLKIWIGIIQLHVLNEFVSFSFPGFAKNVCEKSAFWWGLQKKFKQAKTRDQIRARQLVDTQKASTGFILNLVSLKSCPTLTPSSSLLTCLVWITVSQCVSYLCFWDQHCVFLVENDSVYEAAVWLQFSKTDLEKKTKIVSWSRLGRTINVSPLNRGTASRFHIVTLVQPTEWICEDDIFHLILKTGESSCSE